MKKVLQVTLFDNSNIGNRLQNYALYTLLTSKGCDVTNLKDRTEYVPDTKTKVKNQVKHVLGIFGNKKYKEKYLQYKGNLKRRAALQSFSNAYIPKVIDASNGTDGIDFSSFDLGIAGSDQVWHHWNQDDKELPYFYLEFLPEEKRNAYAASFGFDEFPEEDLDQHKYGLSHMHSISCREQSGCNLVKSVTGKDVPHVLDPTLLLSAEEWRKLENQANAYVRSLKDYVFIYFLGNITDEYRNEIEKKANGKKIVNFTDWNNSKIAECGPVEFLYLIDHCDYFLTDSFHGTVFATLFNKEFTVFRRKQEGFENMFSRINELLISTGHEEKAYGGVDPADNVETFDILKQRSLDYLDKILK